MRASGPYLKKHLRPRKASNLTELHNELLAKVKRGPRALTSARNFCILEITQRSGGWPVRLPLPSLARQDVLSLLRPLKSGWSSGLKTREGGTPDGSPPPSTGQPAGCLGNQNTAKFKNL